MKRFAVWSLALLALLGIVLLRMPARSLATLAQTACAGQCRLAELQGPWWAGQGLLYVRTSTEGAWQALGPMSWDLLPARGGLLELRLGGGHATLHAGPDGLRAEIDDLVLPAATVLAQPALGLPAAGWHGNLRLRQTTLQGLASGAASGQGQLEWLGAGSSLLEDQPLGTLVMRWRWRAPQDVQAQLEGGSAGRIELRSELDIRAQPDGRRPSLTLRGQLALSGTARERLEKYVRFIGKPDPQTPGHYQLAWPPDRNS